MSAWRGVWCMCGRCVWGVCVYDGMRVCERVRVAVQVSVRAYGAACVCVRCMIYDVRAGVCVTKCVAVCVWYEC